MSNEYFRFKQFTVRHDRCAMKVGTDGVLLGATASGGQRILDIGTGTGLVALMMAQRFPEAIVTAIDIDEAACGQARENVADSPFADRIMVVHASLDEYAARRNSEEKPNFDAIVCNPPFFEDSLECPDGQRAAARHASALPFAELVGKAKGLLADDGMLTLIIPTAAVARIETQCAYNNMYIERRLHIKTVERKTPKRTLLFVRKHPVADSSIEIQCLMEGGQRSEWYNETCKDFYL